jgi:hypothetical protein
VTPLFGSWAARHPDRRRTSPHSVRDGDRAAGGRSAGPAGARHRPGDAQLAARIQSKAHNPDLNALWPQRFAIRLKDGWTWDKVVDKAIGHPDNPLSRAAQLAKFRRAWALAPRPLAGADAVIGRSRRSSRSPTSATSPRSSGQALIERLADRYAVGGRLSRRARLAVLVNFTNVVARWASTSRFSAPTSSRSS